MDYELTQKYYDDAKQKYEKKGDQIEWDNWNRRVKDSAGQWNQNPHNRETIYPIKKYWRLARIRAKYDRKEYLETRSMWTGVNAYGDEQTIGRVDPEIFTETKWNHRRVPDPKDRNNIITEPFGIQSIKQLHKAESLFDAEKAREYYNQPHEDGCILVVRDDTRDGPPIEIISFDEWESKPFEELTNLKPVNNNEQQRNASTKGKQ